MTTIRHQHHAYVPRYGINKLLRKGIKQLADLTAQIRLANDSYDTMRKAGLEREAKVNVLPKINDLVRKRDDLERQLHEQGRVIACKLLGVFAACDIATIALDNFAECLDTATEADKAFAKLVQEQADGWNKLVQLIDEGGQNNSLSMFYADMAEEIADAVMPTIYNIIQRYQKSDKGEQLL